MTLKWAGGYLLVPRARVAPGVQASRVAQPMRSASCEEVACEWFMHGKEGTDPDPRFDNEQRPFVHPAGVECGDFARCWHPNCPCPARKPSHKVPADQLPLKHIIATTRDTRLVEPTEWIDRLRDGFYAREEISKRGF